jgi:hypothetical protein
MPGAQRIDEVVALLEGFVLGEVNLSKRQIGVALKLLDLMVPDAPPPDDGDEPTALMFRPKYLT